MLVAEAQLTVGPDVKISSLTGDPPHHPLQQGSPAIDAADPIYCLLDDQPFTARPQYGNCDVGAYEYPKQPPALRVRRIHRTGRIRRIHRTRQNRRTTPRSRLRQLPHRRRLPFRLRQPPPPDCIHIVSEGENLFRIAILYNMTVREISSFNNLAARRSIVSGSRVDNSLRPL